jgi:hypothetical protein
MAHDRVAVEVRVEDQRSLLVHVAMTVSRGPGGWALRHDPCGMLVDVVHAAHGAESQTRKNHEPEMRAEGCRHRVVSSVQLHRTHGGASTFDWAREPQHRRTGLSRAGNTPATRTAPVPEGTGPCHGSAGSTRSSVGGAAREVSPLPALRRRRRDIPGKAAASAGCCEMLRRTGRHCPNEPVPCRTFRAWPSVCRYRKGTNRSKGGMCSGARRSERRRHASRR